MRKYQHFWILSLFIAVLVINAGLTAVAYAEGSDKSQTAALQWLTDMRHAVSSLSYKGEVAYLKDKDVGGFQLYHSTIGGNEKERLFSMNTPRREVIRDAEKVACYYPDSKSVFVENKPRNRSSLLEIPEDVAQLASHYRFGLQGQEFIAKRQAQVVSIEPLDNFRYARLIWVDTDSKLPIKFEMLDDDGQVLEQMVFTSLNVGEISPADLEASSKADSFQWKVNEKQTLPLDTLDWVLNDVPAGFQMVSYTRMKKPPGDRSVDHILLSDGFASVSIYIEAAKGEAKEHPRKLGTLNSRTRLIDGFQLTVMGEVPARTVEAIAGGIKHRQKS